MIGRALERTAALWPDVEYAYRFVHAVAHWLGNPHEESAAMVRRRVNGVLSAMQRHRAKAGTRPASSIISRRSRAAIVLGCSTPMRCRTCRAPTTISNSCSAPSAITSGVRRAARQRPPVRFCAARSGCSLPLRPAYRRPRREIWAPRTGSTGGACASAWREAAARELYAPAFGTILPLTWRLLNSKPAS